MSALSDYERLRKIVLDLAEEAKRSDHLTTVAFGSRLEVAVETMVKSTQLPKQEADRFLSWYNREFGRRFSLNETLVALVRSLLSGGYGQEDLRLVSLYLKHRWQEDPKMAEYLVPSSLLTRSKFGERLDCAREWWGGARGHGGGGDHER
jgi:uncharacterized protein